ncbi:MAG TPA: response regulator transcription factor [Nitrospira sp.]|nr:response regulator transcription factor [Nitrospira sp.]
MESEGSEVIRILLVDDVEKIRESLRGILATYPYFEIVGEACDGEEAVQAVAQLKPSVVVMDINMPRLNGIEATAWIRKTYPHVVVVGVSAIATEATCQLMQWAGATTVVSKDAVEQLRQVIVESVGQKSQSEVLPSDSQKINSFSRETVPLQRVHFFPP